MATILFLHGWHSIPGGVKPAYLANRGHTVINPALDDNDFVAAVRTAQVEFERHQPQVVVGSSRGGAIAMNIVTGSTPLVLLCPAWKRWGSIASLKPDSVILHSRKDEVIPFAESEELVSNNGLSPETLIEIGSDHRLADDASLSVLHWACEVLASGQRMPWLDDDSQRSVKSFGGNSSGKSSLNSQSEAGYICDSCGEEIVIPLDLTEGSSQTYVEDCPVCCRTNTIHIEFACDGTPHVQAKSEQDYE